MQPTLTKKAADLFKSNPEVKCFYFTSDGQAFKLDHLAELNASKLKDRTVTDVYHPDMSAEEVAEYKKELAAEAEAGVLASFKRANPELSKLIKINSRNPKL